MTLDLADELAAAKHEIASLRALLEERWDDAAKLYLRGMNFSPKDGLTIDAHAGLVPLIGAHLAETMRGIGAPNYVEFRCNHAEMGPLVLTLQRANGKTPAEIASEAKAELAALKGSLPSPPGSAA